MLDIFEQAHQMRLEELDRRKTELSGLSPFELMIYASLYAYEHLIPGLFEAPRLGKAIQTEQESTWRAINKLFIWKLATAPESLINLSEQKIVSSFAQHLSPFLFPTPSGLRSRSDLRYGFEQLLAAQVELDAFINQSVDAFSYDDAIRFVFRGSRLEIEKTNPEVRIAWQRDGQKLSMLHNYWFYRALITFAESEVARQQIGSTENHEANRLAFIRAIRTQLQLDEVYGIDESVLLDSGERADLFQALLSLELTSAFFQRDFLVAFNDLLKKTDDWTLALTLLALDGLKNGSQNRFPLTWADRNDKVRSIVGWTVNAKYPQGSTAMATSILDFCTNDWSELASRLRTGTADMNPELFERPFLKLGQYFVQLPWITGLQNNSTAAINNLRRIGARRDEASMETRRIEERLGKLFKSHGFQVSLNWNPPSEKFPGVGEIDLICALDGIVLVIEVKSTFVRQSQRDAWLHSSTTLRKAGQQLRRKVAAVQQAITEESDLMSLLGLNETSSLPVCHGWIVDTSIECDHQRFNGFLKISMEEIIIALRDDQQLLADSVGMFEGDDLKSDQPVKHDQKKKTLYSDGFTGARFVEVIETEAVWDALCAEQDA